jgi:hypothetical protein
MRNHGRDICFFFRGRRFDVDAKGEIVPGFQGREWSGRQRVDLRPDLVQRLALIEKTVRSRNGDFEPASGAVSHIEKVFAGEGHIRIPRKSKPAR